MLNWAPANFSSFGGIFDSDNNFYTINADYRTQIIKVSSNQIKTLFYTDADDDLTDLSIDTNDNIYMIQGNNIKQIEIATGDLRIFKDDADKPTKIYNINDDLYLINNDGKTLEKYTLPSTISEKIYELSDSDYNNERISFLHNSSKGVSLVVENIVSVPKTYTFYTISKNPYSNYIPKLTLSSRVESGQFISGAYDSYNNFYAIKASEPSKIVKISNNGIKSEYFDFGTNINININSIHIDNRISTNDNYISIIQESATNLNTDTKDKLYAITTDSIIVIELNPFTSKLSIDTAKYTLSINAIDGFDDTSTYSPQPSGRSVEIKDVTLDENSTDNPDNYLYLIVNVSYGVNQNKSIIKRIALPIDTSQTEDSNKIKFQDIAYLDKIDDPQISYDNANDKMYILDKKVGDNDKIYSITLNTTNNNFRKLYYSGLLKVESNLNLSDNKTYKKTLFHDDDIYALVENVTQNGNDIELYTLSTTGSTGSNTGTTEFKSKILQGISTPDTISTGIGKYIYIVINNQVIRYDIVNDSIQTLSIEIGKLIHQISCITTIKIDDKDHILLALQETGIGNDYKIYAMEHKETLDNYIEPSLFYNGIDNGADLNHKFSEAITSMVIYESPSINSNVVYVTSDSKVYRLSYSGNKTGEVYGSDIQQKYSYSDANVIVTPIYSNNTDKLSLTKPFVIDSSGKLITISEALTIN